MIVIDTREPAEYARSHVDGSINIPPGKFMSGTIPAELVNTPMDETIVLYCISGSRSNDVAYILRQLGFTSIVNGKNQGQVEKRLASAQ